MKFEDFDEIDRLVSRDRDARTAAVENDLRRALARSFERATQQRGLSLRGLARAMNSSVSQVRRLLHRELGGSLTLCTLVRAADLLGLKLEVRVRSAEPSRLNAPEDGTCPSQGK